MKTIDVEMSVVVDSDPREFLGRLKTFVEGCGVKSAEITAGFDVSAGSLEKEFEKFVNELEVEIEANQLIAEIEAATERMKRSRFQGEVQKILKELEESRLPVEEKFNMQINSIEEWLRRHV